MEANPAPTDAQDRHHHEQRAEGEAEAEKLSPHGYAFGANNGVVNLSGADRSENSKARHITDNSRPRIPKEKSFRFLATYRSLVI